jgi:thiamine biosynthesis lipoprotein
VAVADGAVCTSTVLRRRWGGTGRRREAEHHLRHPGTGAPLRNGLLSVSVIAGSATQAEVLTKAAFVAGAEQAADVLGRAGVTGALVLDSGRMITLDGFDRFRAAPPANPVDDPRPEPGAVG